MELTLDQALQKGIEAHKAGKVQEADQYYTAILKACPEHPDANHNLGVLAVSLDKVREALPFFKTALAANAKVAQFWISYIDALIKLDRLDDAKALLDNAKRKGAKGFGLDQIEKRLDSATLNNSNVQEPSKSKLEHLLSLYAKGLLKSALNETEALLEEFPNSLNLYNIIGVTNKALGNLDEAIVAFKKALSIKPNHAELYNNIGAVLYDQEKPNEAIKAYKNALSLKPDYAEAHNNLGVSLEFQDRPDEAIEAYKKALVIEPEYIEAHNNLGNAKRNKGNLKEALEAYKKALIINPDYVDAHINMGNVFKDLHKLDEATEAYKKAIDLQPKSVEAYNNLGITLKNQGQLDEAIEAYKQALSIQPDYAEAYNNMGLALHIVGKSAKAIDAFKKAISIKPEDPNYWNNIFFPLQAIKTEIASHNELSLFYPNDHASNYSKLALSILKYKLNRGHRHEKIYLEKALNKMPIAENLTIRNPAFNVNSKEETQPVLKKICALTHFGRSGTGLMHSLLDGHPEISTLPSIYFSEYYDYFTWQKIICDGWDEMVNRFIEIYDVLFDAASTVPVESKSRKLLHNIGIKEGMGNLGIDKNESLKVNKDLFRKELKRLINSQEKLNALVFFKLVHIAYDKTINDNNFKKLIFYHIHNPDTYAIVNFCNFASNARWIMMVREPIQSCESWINKCQEIDLHSEISNGIISMLFEVNNLIYSRQKSIGIRLEDLKNEPKKTIQALSKWMGIKETDSLYQMTAQGKKWWGDPISPDYSKDGMNPFGKTSINRKPGSIFSERDQFILRTLFYPFSVLFGYTQKNDKKFKHDLNVVRPMLDKLFDFELKILKQTEGNAIQFKNSGSYLYLRSALIERWNTLNEFNTYPNMIQRLKI